MPPCRSRSSSIPALVATSPRALRESSRGDVLFDAASRGRYATDASIYQIDAGRRVRAARPSDDVARRIDIARELKVPMLPRGARHLASAARPSGAALVIDTQQAPAQRRRVRRRARAPSTVEPGIVLDQLNALAEAARPVVSRSTSRPARRPRSAAWPATTPAARARIAYGNMVHNVARHRRLAGRRQRGRASARSAEDCAARGARASPTSCAALARSASATRSSALCPKVLRRVGGYNLDIFDPQSERPYTTDGSVNLAHLLVGAEGTLAVHARA